MSVSNTVEIVVKVLDQATAGLDTVRAKLGGIKLGLGSLAAAAGVTLSIGAAFKKFVDESSEAEQAMSSFTLAFRNMGQSIGIPKQEMIDFAAQVQKTTQYTDEAVLGAQTVLFRFGSVTGETFKRARKDIVDVAAALRTDLSSAAQIVGRALENPAQGMRMLRSLGVVLSASQQALVKDLVATGRQAEAQALILTELERRYRGAAETAGNTFAGAMAKVKNAFGELFENPDALKPMTEGLNQLSTTLQNPALKESIVALVDGMAKLANYAVTFTAAVVHMFSSGSGEADAFEGRIRDIQSLLAGGGGIYGTSVSSERRKELEDELALLLKKQQMLLGLGEIGARMDSAARARKAGLSGPSTRRTPAGEGAGVPAVTVAGGFDQEEIDRLNKATMTALGKADAAYRERLDALKQLRAAFEKSGGADGVDPKEYKARLAGIEKDHEEAVLAIQKKIKDGMGFAWDGALVTLTQARDSTETELGKIEDTYGKALASISALLHSQWISAADAAGRGAEASAAYIEGMEKQLRSQLDRVRELAATGLLTPEAAGARAEDATHAYFERMETVFRDRLTEIQDLLREGLLTPQQAAAMGEEAGVSYADALHRAIADSMAQVTAELENALDPSTVTAQMDELVRTSAKITDEALSESRRKVADAQAGVDAFVGALTEGLQNAAREGKLSIKDLVRYMISQLLSKALMNAISELGNALSSALSSGGGGGGGGLLSSIVSGIGSLFGGGKAGGGFAAGGMLAAAGGMTMVGEEGPELVSLPRGSRVYSNSVSKQMAAPVVNFAPVSNVLITASDKDAQTLRQEFAAAIARNNQVQQKQVAELLNRNGFGRMR